MSRIFLQPCFLRMKDWWMMRTIHGMSDELHQVLQGPACSTILVDDTNNFVDTRNFVFVFDYLLRTN